MDSSEFVHVEHTSNRNLQKRLSWLCSALVAMHSAQLISAFCKLRTWFFCFLFLENGIETNPQELYMKLFKILLSRPSPVQEHGQELNRSTDKSCRKDISQRTVCAEEGGWSWCS